MCRFFGKVMESPRFLLIQNCIVDIKKRHLRFVINFECLSFVVALDFG
jgi:hypothetical protein